MFGSLGLPEILLILVIALLVFGPKRLPEVGRTIGKGLGEFRRASADLKRTVNAELALDEDERTRTARRPEPARAPGKAPAPSASANAAGAGTGAALPEGVAAREPAELEPEIAEPAAAGSGAGAPAAAASEEPDEAPAPSEPVTTH